MQHWSDGPGGGSGDLATLRETVAEVFARLSSGLDDPAAVGAGVRDAHDRQMIMVSATSRTP
jgi:hypothetical protein